MVMRKVVLQGGTRNVGFVGCKGIREMLMLIERMLDVF